MGMGTMRTAPEFHPDPSGPTPAPGPTPGPTPGSTPGTARPDARAQVARPDAAAEARLNLLLTYGGWRSDSWADRLPRLLEPMGVRAWRASSAREASDLIGSMRVHVAVVDLRLPLDRRPGEPAPGACGVEDEAGPRVLELLSRLETPPPTLVIKRGRSAREDAREMTQALNLGAFAAIDRPVDLERMLDAMRRLLKRHYEGRWPGDSGPARIAPRHPHAPPGATPGAPPGAPPGSL